MSVATSRPAFSPVLSSKYQFEKDGAGYVDMTPDEAAASIMMAVTKSMEHQPEFTKNVLSYSASTLLSSPGPGSPAQFHTGSLPNSPKGDERVVKRQQRLMKNRQSAALSRLRKKEYITDLEARAQVLTTEKLEMQLSVAKLANQSLEAHQHMEHLQRRLRDIQAENEAMRARIAARERLAKGECTQNEYEDVVKGNPVSATPVAVHIISPLQHAPAVPAPQSSAPDKWMQLSSLVAPAPRTGSNNTASSTSSPIIPRSTSLPSDLNTTPRSNIVKSPSLLAATTSSSSPFASRLGYSSHHQLSFPFSTASLTPTST